ncbi:RNA 3'-terminal phosphate cyclase/enolpyruvate transferase [Sporodiniella umbellata]|nr:RNA 3'-terminal phosphate cyclase/enolpyruvate transferase [Sporodiniella umbellata]
MKEFNIDIEYENDLRNIIIKKNEYQNPETYVIEPDVTALSYFISLTHVIGDFSDYGDTFLTLAAISPLLRFKTVISGVEYTRDHETDRIHNVCVELKKLIGNNNVIENKDGFEVIPNIQELKERAIIGRNTGKMLSINTYHDQRFAMSFAILGCYNLLEDGLPWLQIENPLCCQKTFPTFFDILEQLNN